MVKIQGFLFIAKHRWAGLRSLSEFAFQVGSFKPSFVSFVRSLWGT